MVKPVKNLVSFAGLDWRRDTVPVDYETALSEMSARAEAIAEGTARECVWLLEHPPLYTAGTSANAEDLLDATRFPVFRSGRGGQYTYHGPGQRIAYVMLNLRQRKQDVRAYVCALEEWLIATLARFRVTGERRTGRVGVWVRRPELGDGREDKIAAIGVRVRKWVTFHGVSINVNPDLEHYSGIVPCGIAEHGVTSLQDLGIDASMDELDNVLQSEFSKRFSGCDATGSA